MWDLVPQPGIEPRAPALGVWSPTHWTTGEVPIYHLNRGRGGGRRAVTGKQITMRKEKWALRILDGRYDHFMTVSV